MGFRRKTCPFLPLLYVSPLSGGGGGESIELLPEKRFSPPFALPAACSHFYFILAERTSFAQSGKVCFFPQRRLQRKKVPCLIASVRLNSFRLSEKQAAFRFLRRFICTSISLGKRTTKGAVGSKEWQNGLRLQRFHF